MEELLDAVRDGLVVSVDAMQKEGLKHVFMELLERLRVEEEINLIEIKSWTRALVTALKGLPPMKRGIYLNDAIAVLLKKKLSMDMDLVVVQFLLDMIPVMGECNDTTIAIQDHKKVIYALLTLLSRNYSQYVNASESMEIKEKVAQVLIASNDIIPFQHVLRMTKWRQYVSCWRQLVIPQEDADSSSEEEEEEEESEDAEYDNEMRQFAENELWKAIPDEYQIKYLGPELIWPDMGVAVIVAWHFLYQDTLFASLLSPLQEKAFDVYYPFAQVFMHLEEPKLKIIGIQILVATIPTKAHLVETTTREQLEDRPAKSVSFSDFAERELNQHKYKGLLQLVLTTMVMLPNASDRQLTWQLWQKLIDIFAIPSRFVALSVLSTTCPFANATAVVIDRLRSEMAKYWNDYYNDVKVLTSITELLSQLLAPVSNGEFAQKSDAFISALSVLRFLLLRDSDNTSRIHSNTALLLNLRGQHRRLAELVQEQNPSEWAQVNDSPVPPSVEKSGVVRMEIDMKDAVPASKPKYDISKLQLLECAFQATIDSFTKLC